MTYSNLEEIIRNWILIAIPKLQELPNQVIMANENAPRPSLPYFTINLTSMTKIGQSNILETDDAGIQRIKYDEDVNVSIQCYGKQSKDLLQRLKDSLQKTSIIKYFDDNCVAVRDDSPISNTAILVDSTIEKRFLFELMVGFAREIEDNVGFVNSVTYDETYIRPDGQEINLE